MATRKNKPGPRVKAMGAPMGFPAFGKQGGQRGQRPQRVEKQDLFEGCFEDLKRVVNTAVPSDLEQTFCNRCRNVTCYRAGKGETSWQQRMSTQEERLLINPHFADPDDPRFDSIRDIDFPSLLREAIVLNMMESTHDWSIPTDAQKDAFVEKAIRESVSRYVPDPPSVEADAPDAPETLVAPNPPVLVDPDGYEIHYADLEEEPLTDSASGKVWESMSRLMPGRAPIPQAPPTATPSKVTPTAQAQAQAPVAMPPKPLPAMPPAWVLPSQDGAIIGEPQGSGNTTRPVPNRPPPPIDPWAVPKTPTNFVKPGARITMGSPVEGNHDNRKKED